MREFSRRLGISHSAIIRDDIFIITIIIYLQPSLVFVVPLRALFFRTEQYVFLIFQRRRKILYSSVAFPLNQLTHPFKIEPVVKAWTVHVVKQYYTYILTYLYIFMYPIALLKKKNCKIMYTFFYTHAYIHTHTNTILIRATRRILLYYCFVIKMNKNVFAQKSVTKSKQKIHIYLQNNIASPTRHRPSWFTSLSLQVPLSCICAGQHIIIIYIIAT